MEQFTVVGVAVSNLTSQVNRQVNYDIETHLDTYPALPQVVKRRVRLDFVQ
jgi:hypothetical protein